MHEHRRDIGGGLVKAFLVVAEVVVLRDLWSIDRSMTGLLEHRQRCLFRTWLELKDDPPFECNKSRFELKAAVGQQPLPPSVLNLNKTFPL